MEPCVYACLREVGKIINKSKAKRRENGKNQRQEKA